MSNPEDEDSPTKARDAQFTRVFIILFSFAHLALIAYYVAFPLFYLRTSWEVFEAGRVFIGFSWMWWIVFVFVALNLLLPLLLIATVADENNAARVDIHMIVAQVVMIFNFLAIVFFVVVYLFFLNKSYSGGYLFNDERWCNNFRNEAPGFCPNTLVASVGLHAPHEYKVTMALAVVFFILAIVHLATNVIARQTGVVRAPWMNPTEGRVLGFLFALAYIGLFVYWCAWPLFQTLFVHGFPLLGLAPGPGAFVSYLYSYQWWFLWPLALHFAPPLLFLWAAGVQKSVLVTRTHFWATLIVCLLTLLSLLVWIYVWIADCNWSWAGGSFCNDYQWCSIHFASSSGSKVCPNVAPAPVPGGLGANPEFVQHFVFTILFILMSTVEIWVNYRMQRYGVFQ